MKARILSLIVLGLVTVTLSSQVPQGFNYQAIARDGVSTNPIASQTINVRLSILSDTLGFKATGAGTYLYEEEFLGVKTNAFGMFTLTMGSGTKVGGTLTFLTINWNSGPLYIGTKIKYPTTSPTYKIMGSAKIWTVPYAMVADKANAIATGSKLSVVSANDATTDALFEVKRKDGQVVFAVYPDAVNIWVPNGLKGSKGGFAVGGFDQAKAFSQDYFRVTPDSVRVYIDNSPAKGSKGGFAVGGFDNAKGILKDYFMNVSGSTLIDVVAGSPQVLWYPNKNAFLAGNVRIGSKDSVGDYSTALGYRSVSMGDYSQAFGYRAKAFGDFSTSIGKYSVAGARSGPGHGVSTASNAFAFGNAAKATGSESYALGSGAEALGTRSFAFGSIGIDTLGNPTSTPTRASGSFSTAIGMGAQATNLGAMALGVSTTASGNSASTFGYGSIASGSYSAALGYMAKATAPYANAVGYYSTASGGYSHAFGYRATSYGYASLALGYYSYTGNQYSAAIGYQARTYADYAGAFGRSATAYGPSSMAIGGSAYTSAAASYGMALGYSSDATNTYAFALGYDAQSSGNTSLAMGYQANASNSYATAIGYQSKASNTYSYSFGYKSEATANNSFAIGSMGIDASGNPNTTPTKASGNYSLAMGMGTQSTALGTIGIGVNSTAAGERSIAIGYGVTANGLYSTSMGSGTSTSAAASYSTALGYGSSTLGSYATALGYNAQANGNKSISIGAYYNYSYYRLIYNPITRRFDRILTNVTKYNIASDDYSIAIGNGNTVSKGGLALGSNNTSRAMGAVAIGHTNYADSAYSFAAGSNAYARGVNSVAIGESVIAEAANSFVIGYNNITNSGYTRDEWVTTDPLFVIGNGGGGSASNAMVVAKNGNTTIYGNLTVTGVVSGGSLPVGSVAWNYLANQNIRLNGYWLSNDGGNEGVFVSTTGLVGINDASPSYNLDVAGNLRTTSSIYSNSNLTVSGSIYGTAVNPDNNANLTVDAGTLHIDGTNNRVGINNAAPAYGLDVTGTMNVTGTGRFGGDVTLSSSTPAFYFTDSDLGEDDFLFGANADVLGITTQGKLPTTILTMTSTGQINMPVVYGLAVGATYRDLYIDNAGKLGYLSSSVRYKKDIESLQDANWIYNLRPVTYRYKDSDGEKQIGLIAEEVENVNPLFVSYNEKGKPETVSYSSLITPLIKVVQDQKETIDRLSEENEALKQRLEKLESVVSSLVSGNK